MGRPAYRITRGEIVAIEALSMWNGEERGKLGRTGRTQDVHPASSSRPRIAAYPLGTPFAFEKPVAGREAQTPESPKGGSR